MQIFRCFRSDAKKHQMPEKKSESNNHSPYPLQEEKPMSRRFVGKIINMFR